MRRQKKFYAWGYADEDLTPDEIKPWEAGIARRALAAGALVLVAIALLLPSVAAVPLSILGLQSDKNDPALQNSASYRTGLYGSAARNDVFSWFGFFVPARTPPDIIAKINADTNAALVHPSVKPRFEHLGAVPKGSTPAELAAFLKSEIDKWGPVIADAKIKVEN